MDKITKTKIVCTIGPAIDSKEKLIEIAKAGCDIIRLNFSHNTQEYFQEKINLIHEVSEETGICLGVLLDTKGPEIRTGIMENGSVEIKGGDEIILTFDDVIGTREKIRVDCEELYKDVEIGTPILIDDGKIRLTVIEKIDDYHTKCRIENGGVMTDRRGVNVPVIHINMPFMNKKDESDIRFACNNCDYIAASFVRCADDIKSIRKICVEEGDPNIKIYAKIENQEGYDNIDEIIEAADGIMVARGDLGVEVDTELVPIYQKIMIKKCNDAGKPAITATQMLESMTSNPRPTRAEANDVANAILDGTDAVMLSGESSVGLYPVEAVRQMDKIANTMEDLFPYRAFLEHQEEIANPTIQDCIGSSIAECCLLLKDISGIICFTESGLTARCVSKYRPKLPIFAVTFEKRTQRMLMMNNGVIPVYSKVRNNEANDVDLASGIAKLHGIKKGEKIIICAGYPQGVGSTNMMKIIEVK